MMAVICEGSPSPGSRSWPSPKTVATLALLTLGLGLNLRAWTLLGPQLHHRFDLRPGAYLALVGVPVLVAALVRLPVGVLTDRYGARVMFPAVSLAAAVSVFGMGLADRLPAVIGAGAAAGVAGAGFGVAATLVSRTFRYGRRGVALGTLSLGPAVAVVFSMVSQGWDPGRKPAAVMLGALLPPILLAGADRLTHSNSTAWILLAAVLLAVAQYVRGRGLRIGMGLAVQFEPGPSPTATTVAVISAADTRFGAAAVVGRLAELAVSDELVVVYAATQQPRDRRGARLLAAGLRYRLPRHDVVFLPGALDPGGVARDAPILGEFVEAGSVPIAVSSTVQVSVVTAQLSSYLHADRVLIVSFTPADGADLHQVWTRGPAMNGT